MTLTCNKCEKAVPDCTCPDVVERLSRVQSGLAGVLAKEALVELAVKRSTVKPPKNVEVN